MYKLVISTFASAALALACVSGGTVVAGDAVEKLAETPDDPMVGADPVGTHQVQPLEGEMTCYAGIINLTFANGMEMNPGYLLRRVQNGGEVVMDAVTFAKGAPPSRAALKYTIGDGNAYTVQKVNGLKGEGTFEGDSAAWTGFSEEYAEAEGTIKTTGKLTAEGISMQSDLFNDAGEQSIRVTVNVPKISNEECNERFTRVAPLAGL